MNFAEQLRKETLSGYKSWLALHEDKLKRLTAALIKNYGKATAYCHGHCSETNFGWCASVLPSEEAYLTRWLGENGFCHRESFNSHGARMIVWML